MIASGPSTTDQQLKPTFAAFFTGAAKMLCQGTVILTHVGTTTAEFRNGAKARTPYANDGCAIDELVWSRGMTIATLSQKPAPVMNPTGTTASLTWGNSEQHRGR